MPIYNPPSKETKDLATKTDYTQPACKHEGITCVRQSQLILFSVLPLTPDMESVKDTSYNRGKK